MHFDCAGSNKVVRFSSRYLHEGLAQGLFTFPCGKIFGDPSDMLLEAFARSGTGPCEKILWRSYISFSRCPCIKIFKTLCIGAGMRLVLGCLQEVLV